MSVNLSLENKESYHKEKHMLLNYTQDIFLSPISFNGGKSEGLVTTWEQPHLPHLN